LARYTHNSAYDDAVLAINATSAGAQARLTPLAGTYYYLKDAHQNVVDITDNLGNVVQHYVYSAFGQIASVKDQGADVTADPLFSNNYTLAGREFDTETGNIYCRARYYSPEIGRFLQQDPSPGDLSSPITSVNRYIYAGNNPIMNSDPSGAISVTDDILDGLAVIGIAAATVLTDGGDFSILAIAENVGVIAGGAAAEAAFSATSAAMISNNWSNWGDDFESEFQVSFLIAAVSFGIGSMISYEFGNSATSGVSCPGSFDRSEVRI
jgi:RHS repeat-associated protein